MNFKSGVRRDAINFLVAPIPPKDFCKFCSRKSRDLPQLGSSYLLLLLLTICGVSHTPLRVLRALQFTGMLYEALTI